jgi:hypothetical protein
MHACHGSCVDPFGHPVEVYEETKEHLVGGRTVLVNPAKIAEDGYAGHVLAVEGQDTGGLLTEPGSAFWRRYLAVQGIVLPVVGRGDFGQ